MANLKLQEVVEEAISNVKNIIITELKVLIACTNILFVSIHIFN
jgi:small nuclear ribonucleoprotein (snRNP)-like protein